MYEIVLLLAADVDIQTIYAMRDESREGRGEVFLGHLENALRQLRAFLKSGPFFDEPVRRLIIRRADYEIFYTIEGARVLHQTHFEFATRPRNNFAQFALSSISAATGGPQKIDHAHRQKNDL